MCGLVGAIGELSDEDIIAFSYLGGLASLRGIDSTGFMDFRNKGKYKDAPQATWGKSLLDSQDTFSPRDKFFTEFVHKHYAKNNPIVLAAHARAATIGKVTINNVHPFKVENVLGMHNGTIRFGLKDTDKFETDSECIFNNLAKDGDECLQDLTDNSNAAYALVWIDSRNKTLNLMRNRERPLYLLKNHQKQVCFWASDRAWLEAVLPYFKYSCNTVTALPADVKLTFDLTKPAEIIESEKEVSFTRKSFFHHGGSGQQRWKESMYPDMEEATKGTTSTTAGTDKTNTVIALRNNHQGMTWYGKYHSYMTKEEFQDREDEAAIAAVSGKKDQPVSGLLRKTFGELYVTDAVYDKILSSGCVGCEHISDKYELVEFIDRDAYLCSTCSEETDWRQSVIDDYLATKINQYKEDTPEVKEGEAVICH